jgi:lysozyme family protein
MTLSQASEIYRREYWERYRCGKWPFPISLFLFDSAVNVGFRQATLFFQRMCRTKVDGLWGPKTDIAVQEWIDDEGVESAFQGLCEARRSFYISLSKPKFEAGWLNRVTALERFAPAHDSTA